MALGGILVILIMLITDPQGGLIRSLPFGSGTISTLIILAQSILYISLYHLGRRAIADYVDMSELYQHCRQDPIASGLYAIAVAIMTLGIAIVIHAAVK